MLYIAGGMRRRSVESLVKLSGISEVRVMFTLNVNDDIWNRVNTRSGLMYEMNSNVFNELRSYVV